MIISVVDKFLVELQAQLDDKKVVLEIDDAVREYLAQKGYDRLDGGKTHEPTYSRWNQTAGGANWRRGFVNGGTVSIRLTKTSRALNLSRLMKNRLMMCDIIPNSYSIRNYIDALIIARRLISAFFVSDKVCTVSSIFLRLYKVTVFSRHKTC